MIARRSLLAAGLCAAGAFAPAHAQQCPRSLTVLNRTDIAVREIYASSSWSRNWGRNLLSGSTLAPGETLPLASLVTDFYDLRVILANNAAFEAVRVNVCDSHGAAVTPSGIELE
jgi:hypothetical protein